MVNQEPEIKGCWVMGADCGEQKHRFVMLDEPKDRQGTLWVSNRMDKVRDALTKMLIKLPEGYELEIVTEGLRSIGGMLMQAATELGIRIYQVNPKALDSYRSLEGQPRKDDDRDAELLAKMRLNNVEGCRLALDSRSEERVLCRFTRLHTQLVGQKRRAVNRVRSRLLELSPEVVDSQWDGPGYSSTGMRMLLERWPGFEGMEKTRVSTIERILRPVTRQGEGCTKMAKAVLEMAGRIILGAEERRVISMELDMAMQQLRLTKTSLAKIDKEIKNAVQAHPIGRKLLEIPGVGQFTAGVLIGEILPLARNVSEGKTATYGGITPLSRRSGKSEGRSKLARGINKHAVRALYLSAVSAKQCSALDDAYYQKQLKRHKGHPKPHVKSFLSLARQRFKVMYKIMTTDARYDKETLIRSHLKRQEFERTQKKDGLAA
ncbi:MAG: transposase [Thermoanaerobaculales bacterium]|nr:transposase [Thermoanaerobaculales bacterium]